MTMTFRAGWLAFTMFWMAHPALACGVCIERPEDSLSDLLLEADSVVVAREDPTRPFRFGVTKVLAGSAEGGATIPFLVDSATRRKLALNALDGVIMIREGQSWIRVGYANAALRDVAGQILSSKHAWKTSPGDRFAFFAALLHDGDPFLRHLAVDELSRAPYDAIRSMTRHLNGEVAQKALVDKTQIPWQPFFIMILGLSDRTEDQELVHDRIAAALHYGTIGQLGAWATALVEIDGVGGVERLAAGWFDRPDSRAEDVRDVVSALALHGRYGDPALRQRILEELASLPSLRPDVVGSVATALGNIGDYTRTDAIRSAVARAPGKELTRIDSAELFAASSYVYRARQIASMTARSDQGNR